MKDNHIVWSDMNLDIEDWRDDLAEQYPDASDDELISKMYEVNNDYLDDTRDNLNIQLSQSIIIIGDLGLWNGRAHGYKMIDSGNIRDCFQSDCDMNEWYVDKLGDKTNNSGLCDIIAKQKDVTQLNYIMERLGYNTPVREEPELEPEKETDAGKGDKTSEEPPKNPSPRKRENPQEKESTKCGDTEKGDSHTNRKPSVKKKVEHIKAQQKKMRTKKAPERQKHRAPAHTNKKTNHKRGKSR